jgi:hypothetical protein
MKVTKQIRATSAMSSAAHKKATYTLPPDVIEAIASQWRYHKTVDDSLADSKSEYVADLVRRDAVKKAAKTR